MGTTLVAMPETTVDEYHGFVFFQHYVRRSGQLPVVDTVAQSLGEQELPDQNLRFGVPAPDRCHASASLFGCHHICHVTAILSVNKLSGCLFPF